MDPPQESLKFVGECLEMDNGRELKPPRVYVEKENR